MGTASFLGGGGVQCFFVVVRGCHVSVSIVMHLSSVLTQIVSIQDGGHCSVRWGRHTLDKAPLTGWLSVYIVGVILQRHKVNISSCSSVR